LGIVRDIAVMPNGEVSSFSQEANIITEATATAINAKNFEYFMMILNYVR